MRLFKNLKILILVDTLKLATSSMGTFLKCLLTLSTGLFKTENYSISFKTNSIFKKVKNLSKNWPGEIFGEAMPIITQINYGQMWKNTKQVSNPSEYLDDLPEDIEKGETPTQVINYFIQELTQTGYLHNHARMYVASYVIHFRRVKWQAGAKFFMTHLLDGDLASNNFSWQWIASTFAGKPYIFNLENVHKYCHQTLSLYPQQNQEIDGSYEEISARLFPNL